MTDPVTDLQIRLTHQDAALDELTDTVLRQQRRIDELQGEIDRLKAVVRELAPPQVGPPGSEPPPPHY